MSLTKIHFLKICLDRYEITIEKANRLAGLAIKKQKIGEAKTMLAVDDGDSFPRTFKSNDDCFSRFQKLTASRNRDKLDKITPF